jgi:hypothetical protein
LGRIQEGLSSEASPGSNIQSAKKEGKGRMGRDDKILKKPGKLFRPWAEDIRPDPQDYDNVLMNLMIIKFRVNSG